MSGVAVAVQAGAAESPPSIALPSTLEGHEVVASVSGGKDSTAMVLALREAQIPARYVFADTQWEARETYDYLDLLRDRLGIAIDVVGTEGGMAARARHRAGFPARTQRWCTRELKLEPIRRYHAEVAAQTGRPIASVVGVRAQESVKRAGMVELEREGGRRRGGAIAAADLLSKGRPQASTGTWVWRPLLAWSVEDVLRMHARHGVPVNPLYQAGADRVGCWPCIFSGKNELRLIAQHDPSRVEAIAALEAELTAERRARNVERPGRYTTARASFFQGRRGGVLGVAPSIADVVSWARTSRGGRQLPLFEAGPTGGCVRWGLCEHVDDEPEEGS